MNPITNKKKTIEYIISKKDTSFKLGVIVTEEKAKEIGFEKVGDCLVPAPKYGNQCNKNANGYTYPDKEKEKVRTYIGTTLVYPYGNTNASMVLADMYRKCYPRVFVKPTEYELMLEINDEKTLFVTWDVKSDSSEEQIATIIKIFKEIFGECYFFENLLTPNIKRTRVNWRILPPGEKPSVHLENQIKERGKNPYCFDVDRLKTIERYKPLEMIEGLNGFDGYYAYRFENICVLESAQYGNATYIIPIKDWQRSTQMTKDELFEKGLVISKIIHNKQWAKDIYIEIKKHEHNIEPFDFSL